jgi:putative transcriptional regulator
VSLTLDLVARTSARGRRNAVRLARTALDITQAELARDVGVTRQTVVSVEAGDYAPSVYLALAIANRLGTTVERLFGQQPEAERSGRTNHVEADE